MKSIPPSTTRNPEPRRRHPTGASTTACFRARWADASEPETASLLARALELLLDLLLLPVDRKPVRPPRLRVVECQAHLVELEPAVAGLRARFLAERRHFLGLERGEAATDGEVLGEHLLVVDAGDGHRDGEAHRVAEHL